MTKASLPDRYAAATWRNTTPVNADESVIGVGFNLGDEMVVGLKLSVDHARHLSESIADYLRDHDARFQSGMSSEIPIDPKSIPEDGV